MSEKIVTMDPIKSNILMVFDHIIKEPDVFILKKINERFHNIYSEYLKLELANDLSNEALLIALNTRPEKNLFKWLSKVDFDYSKNYVSMYNRWKEMFIESPELLGKIYLDKFIKGYCINNIYIWNEVDDIRQRYELVRLFGKTDINYVTGPMDVVIKKFNINGVYDYDADRVAALNEFDEFDDVIFGIANYPYNFEDFSINKLKHSLDKRRNISLISIIPNNKNAEYMG